MLLTKSAIKEQLVEIESDSSETMTRPRKEPKVELNHDGTAKRYRCYSSRCTKTFTRISLLWRHLKVHAEHGHNYVCKFPGCSKSFSEVGRL